MENFPLAVGEQFLRDRHLTMQRDSWSEEIDPLRSNNESDLWSKNGGDFQRDSPQTLEEDSQPLDGDQLERDSLSDEDDQPVKPSARLPILANGDSVARGKGRELVGRHHPARGGYERPPLTNQDYSLHYIGDSPSAERAYPARAGYERDHEPAKGYERLSVDRAHTMKDFEKQITELKKENFNLKLRIYFLEEQVQRHCDSSSSEELQRMNIELKVEVESLKHEYQEKQNLLDRASKAMESLAGEHNFTMQQMKEDHLKQLQDLQEAGRQKICLLEEEANQQKAELKKFCALLEQERMQRFNAEERLLAVKEQYNKSMTVLEERDWIIQCLNETLRSKDALIAQLEKQMNTMIPGGDSKKAGPLPESEPKERRSQSPGLSCRDCLATKSPEERDEDVRQKVKEMEKVINELQQKLEDSRAGLANEERNSIKRDKAIQGLTLALKKKTKENEKLVKEMENLSAVLREVREAGPHDQSLRNDRDPDYKKLVFTIQAQQDLCSRLHEYERESGSLQKELDAIVMLRQWLEKDIQSNQELRKVLEAQIEAKRRASDSMSFLGDQTSYMSICLDHYNAEGNGVVANRPCMTSVETQTGLPDSSLTEERLLEQSVPEEAAREEGEAAVAKHLKYEFAGRGQSATSSSTQTEPKLYADKSILVDLFESGDETSRGINGAKEILCNVKSHPIGSEFGKSSGGIQNDKQQKCLSNNLTKSKIPVLLKSPFSKRLRTEACLNSRENEHEKLEKENGRLLEELKCAKREIGVLLSNAQNPNGTPEGWDIPDHTGTESSRQNSQGGLKPEGLSGQLKREKEAFKSNTENPNDRPEELDVLHHVGSESSRQNSQEDLKPEGLSGQLKREKEAFKANTKNPNGTPEVWHILHHVGSECSRQNSQDLKPEGLSGQLKRETEVLGSNTENPNGSPEGWDALHHVWLESSRQNSQELKPDGLSGQFKCAKRETEALQSNIKGPQGWDVPDHTRTESSRPDSQGDLMPEGLRGHGAEIKADEEAGKCTKFLSDMGKSEKEERASLQLPLGDDELPGKLEPARLENGNSPGRDVSDNTNPKFVLDDANLAEREFSAQSLHKELQLENLRLAEQLKRAQIDIERLQARESSFENKNALSDSTSDSDVRSLIKELQYENQKLVEQLKCAQVEIEKLREEKVLEDIDGSFRLDHQEAEDRESEHSFLDKTITNAISLREVHNGDPDIEVQVSSHNFSCQNIAGLCCHHDRFCIECANNQETLIFQSSSFKKVSTIQKECKLLTVSHSHRAFEDTSLSKYDLLVQSQARELSHQRQKIKESHNLSMVCSKNFINVLKAFEGLLATTSVDSNIALGFQEQLAQAVEWLKELEYKLSDAYYGEDDANSDHSADSLLYTPSRLVPGHKMWADKRGCHVLGLVEDYNALRKQILEAKAVLEETEAFIDHGVQTAVLNMTEHFGNVFFEKLNRTKQSLEEANCLLKLLWRVSLPLQTHSSYSIRQVEEANLEMTRLRKRVLEQEKLLSGMVKRVYSGNQMKEDIEKLILNQLAMTHEILKRAKGNLEVQVVDKR